MPATPTDIWWLFVAGAAALIVILSALVGALILNHRRVQELHRDFARRLLTAQEEERAWAAREVHDDVLQRLVIVGTQLDQVSQGSPTEAARAETLRGVRGDLGDLAGILRNLAHRLHPSILDRGGLVAALHRLVDDAGPAFGVAVSAELPPTPVPIDPERGLAVYRIAQEALRNVARHSGTGEAVLDLRTRDGTLELTVTDRGRGFTPGAGAPTGIGLTSMEERARNAGGSLEILSQPGAGTTVRGRFPLPRPHRS